jgi:nucleosome binding factor SPN SPT16 subunit
MCFLFISVYRIFTHNFVRFLLSKQIEASLDADEVKVTHAQIAENVANEFDHLSDDQRKARYKFDGKIAIEDIGLCYDPIIMSGGDYNLKIGNMSNQKILDPGTIILQLGASYKSICANVGRTYFIQPTTEYHEAAHKLLKEVHKACINAIKTGQKMNGIYEAAQAVIMAKNPALLPKFSQDCGSVINFEFRNPSLALNAKNTKVIRNGMAFNICIGFKDLSTKGNHTEVKENTTGDRTVFAVLIADTVIAQDETPLVLTSGQPSDYDQCLYDYDEDNGSDGGVDELDTRTSMSINRASLRDNPGKEADRQKVVNQELLAERRRREALEALAKNEITKNFDKNKVSEGKFVSFENAGVLLKAINEKSLPTDKIYVDAVNESILCPINGELVPFHIGTMKVPTLANGSSSELRLMFLVPDTKTGKDNTPSFANFKKKFVRELVYRSTAQTSLQTVFNAIKELRTSYIDRKKQQFEAKSIVAQRALEIDKQSGAFAAIKDIVSKFIIIIVVIIKREYELQSLFFNFT